MKLPTTRRACAKLYRYRRLHNCALTKLDMYLGGMICCSEEEFLYRNSSDFNSEVIGGERPCLCKGGKNDRCGGCPEETDATLRMPWEAPLYEDKQQK